MQPSDKIDWNDINWDDVKEALRKSSEALKKQSEFANFDWDNFDAAFLNILKNSVRQEPSVLDVEHISYDANGTRAELDISAATVLQGMRRARLRTEAQAQKETGDVDSFILRLLSYPDICAVMTGTIVRESESVTVSREQSLSFELFLALPEPLMIRVEDAVYRLNPHWLPAPSPEDQKKAVTPSTTGSSAFTTRRKRPRPKSRSRMSR